MIKSENNKGNQKLYPSETVSCNGLMGGPRQKNEPGVLIRRKEKKKMNRDNRGPAGVKRGGGGGACESLTLRFH